MRFLLFFCISITLCGQVKKYSTYNANTIQMISVPTNIMKMSKLVSDKDFRNTNYTLQQVLKYVKSYNGNIWTTNEIKHIYNVCKSNRINIIIFLSKIEHESKLLTWGLGHSELYNKRMRWCLGAGMYTTIISNGVKIKPTAGFSNQIVIGCSTLKKHYDNFYSNKSIYINQGTIKLVPSNASTYALYRYTPYYGKVIENGVECGGNDYLMIVYNRLLSKWKSINS